MKRRRMTKLTMFLMLALVAGAIMNIAVTWGIVRWHPAIERHLLGKELRRTQWGGFMVDGVAWQVNARTRPLWSSVQFRDVRTQVKPEERASFIDTVESRRQLLDEFMGTESKRLSRPEVMEDAPDLRTPLAAPPSWGSLEELPALSARHVVVVTEIRVGWPLASLWHRFKTVRAEGMEGVDVNAPGVQPMGTAWVVPEGCWLESLAVGTGGLGGNRTGAAGRLRRNPSLLCVPGFEAYPWWPVWPAFAFNTLVYAAVVGGLWWTTTVAWRRVRRWRRGRRGRRGLCPACAYPVGSSAVCTECGGAVRARPA